MALPTSLEELMLNACSRNKPNIEIYHDMGQCLFLSQAPKCLAFWGQVESRIHFRGLGHKKISTLVALGLFHEATVSAKLLPTWTSYTLLGVLKGWPSLQDHRICHHLLNKASLKQNMILWGLNVTLNLFCSCNYMYFSACELPQNLQVSDMWLAWFAPSPRRR